MRDTWHMWRRAVPLLFNGVVRLVGINLIWLVCSLPLITAGPATLAAYWWIASDLRDENKEGYRAFFKAFTRLFWRGLVWLVGLAVVLFVAYANLVVWHRFLPPLTAALIQVLAVYVVIFVLAMQPYLLEALAVEGRPWGEALKRSAWHVVTNPLYSHLNVLLPAIILGAAGLKTHTVIPLVLVAVVLGFMGYAAADVPQKYGMPSRKKQQGKMEDLL
ncbi:MAG: DUF624 domain-containing protein [Mycobacterium leprae]